MDLRKDMRDEIAGHLKTMSCSEVAKIYKVHKTSIYKYAIKNGIKLPFKRGERRTNTGIELFKYAEKYGLDRASKKYKKDVKKVRQCVYNWRHKLKVGQ